MATKFTKIAVIGTFVVAAAAVSAGTYAAQHASSGTRPGWGYGDKNHVHTGPPGQSVRVSHGR